MKSRSYSRDKGKRGERAWRDVLRDEGFTARRGQQYAGSPDSPDVVCEELKGLHMEVKCVERASLDEWCAQAERDGKGKPWIVAHKKSWGEWRVTMPKELFFKLLRDGVEGV